MQGDTIVRYVCVSAAHCCDFWAQKQEDSSQTCSWESAPMLSPSLSFCPLSNTAAPADMPSCALQGCQLSTGACRRACDDAVVAYSLQPFVCIFALSSACTALSLASQYGRGLVTEGCFYKALSRTCVYAAKRMCTLMTACSFASRPLPHPRPLPLCNSITSGTLGSCPAQLLHQSATQRCSILVQASLRLQSSYPF